MLDYRYPKDIFVPGKTARVSDEGDAWKVTFDNVLMARLGEAGLPLLDGSLVPRRLTVTIRKFDAGVVDIQ